MENSLDEVGVPSYMETAGFYFKGSSPKKMHRKNSQVGLCLHTNTTFLVSPWCTHTHTSSALSRRHDILEKNYNKHPGGNGARL